VTERNVRNLGNDLFVDAGSLGSLSAVARAHMASINFQHGIVRPHEHARTAVLESGSRSQLLRLAAVMPEGAAIRCAVVNDLAPVGVSVDPPRKTAPILHASPTSRVSGASWGLNVSMKFALLTACPATALPFEI
jgi:hypothetical protein